MHEFLNGTAAGFGNAVSRIAQAGTGVLGDPGASRNRHARTRPGPARCAAESTTAARLTAVVRQTRAPGEMRMRGRLEDLLTPFALCACILPASSLSL